MSLGFSWPYDQGLLTIRFPEQGRLLNTFFFFGGGGAKRWGGERVDWPSIMLVGLSWDPDFMAYEIIPI